MKSGAVDGRQYRRIGNATAATTTGQRRRPASHTHTRLRAVKRRRLRACFAGSVVFSASTRRLGLATLWHSSGIDSAPQPQPHASLAPRCRTMLAVQRFLRSDAQAAGDVVAHTNRRIACGIQRSVQKFFFNSLFSVFYFPPRFFTPPLLDVRPQQRTNNSRAIRISFTSEYRLARASTHSRTD